jgi:hypothetical protein
VIDLTGSVIVLTRGDMAVSAIVSDRVGNDDQAVNWVVPMIVIRHQSTSRMPGGQGNARISKQIGRYEARCYGKTRVEAERLARIVADSWHEAGIRDGTNGAIIRQSWVDVIIGAINDTDRLTKPYTTVLIDVLAEAQPVS